MTKEINIIEINESCIVYEESDEEDHSVGSIMWPEDVDYDED